ncbi:DUF3397 domain-containing protein [Priestia flexa]|uniref:DUF3397 domain-containing protein n=1 Tax=Priestia TaxID=2800373 RepID=UPI002206E161|nr:DUF3397 domain-containing protein [Priestia flexa]MDT2045695.1 DUF3397 domain-containing protein [Priestia flexa]USY54263.1 DUF3397 domain-containing protein [Bacillus sp. 1780r2a1]
MGSLVASILATFITLPVVGFFVLYTLLKKVIKNRRKAVHISTYVSTIFFIVSTHYFAKQIFDQSFLWLIILVLLVLAMIVMLINWQVKKDLQLKRMTKGMFRISFFFFLFSHVLLVVSGLIFELLKL